MSQPNKKNWRKTRRTEKYPLRERLVLPEECFKMDNLLEETIEGEPSKLAIGPITEWANPTVETLFHMFRLLSFLEDRVWELADISKDFQQRIMEAERKNPDLFRPPLETQWHKVKRRADELSRELDRVHRPPNRDFPDEMTDSPCVGADEMEDDNEPTEPDSE